MKSVSGGQPGRQPMTEKRELYVLLIRQGVSNSAACRSLEIARVSEELNRRPRKVLAWQTPEAMFTTLQNNPV